MDNQETKVNRTTITLYRGMFELLKTNPFDSITVNDICQHTIVSRSTFYTYFADKYELVLFCLERERAKLEISQGKNVFDNIYQLLKSIEEQQDVYQNLLLAQANRELNQMILGQLSKNIGETILKTSDFSDALRVKAIFNSYGVVGSIMWWIESGSKIEVKDLASYLYEEMKS